MGWGHFWESYPAENLTLQLKQEKKKKEEFFFFFFLLTPTTFSVITPRSLYKLSFSSIMCQLAVIRICSENCQMTEYFFSRINETFLLLIILLSNLRPAREQWKPGFRRQRPCRSTVGDPGGGPKSYQRRRHSFHSLIASHGYFQKMETAHTLMKTVKR